MPPPLSPLASGDDVGIPTRSPQGVGDLRAVEASFERVGWNVGYQQLDPGQALTETIASDLGEVSLVFERHSRAVECVGETPRKAVTLVVPVRPGSVHLNGCRLEASKIGIYGPGTEIDALAPDRVSAWNIHVPIERFVADREALGLGSAGFHADRPEFRVVNGRIEASVLATLLPGGGLARSRLAIRELAGEVVQDAIASIAGADEVDGHAGCSRQPLRAARDYIHAHLGDPIRIPDVCAAAGVGQRTLERLFRSTLDMTPKGYVRACRLNAVHRTLTDPVGCEAPVTDVALRYGFTHLGRFAGEYRAFFGCLPHQDRGRALRRPMTISG